MGHDPSMSTDGELAELRARQAIYAVLVRYCKGVDRLDPEIMQSTYHPDGIDERGEVRTPAEFAARIVSDFSTHSILTSHNVTNVNIRIDGNAARCESGVISITWRKDGQLRIGAARYIDRFECRYQEWRIAHRLVISDIAGVLTTAEAMATPAGYLAGTRGHDDASYRADVP
jgi:hypothetical protein